MINVNQWRVSIGLWACRQISCSTHPKDASNIESSSRTDEVILITRIKDLILFIGVFFSLLLILSGDIEVNPGPKTGNFTIKNPWPMPFYARLLVTNRHFHNMGILSHLYSLCQPSPTYLLYFVFFYLLMYYQFSLTVYNDY